MQGLVSTLPKPYEDQVLALWDELENLFGLRYVRTTPVPHFTWQLGEAYQLEKIVPVLEQVVAQTEPFDISIKGVESFIGQSPVVFLKILKDPTLMRVHSQIWHELLPYINEPNLLYSPGLWRPHITLAMQDLDWDQLKVVLDHLFAKKIDWHVLVDHVSVLTQLSEGGIVLERHFQFGKGLIY